MIRAYAGLPLLVLACYFVGWAIVALTGIKDVPPLFAAIPLCACGLWSPAMWRASDLRKHDVLSTVDAVRLAEAVDQIGRQIWLYVGLNFFAAIIVAVATHLLSVLLAPKEIAAISIGCLIFSTVTMPLFYEVWRRITDAAAMLDARARAEKDRDEMIKDLTAGSREKPSDDAVLHGYVTVWTPKGNGSH